MTPISDDIVERGCRALVDQCNRRGEFEIPGREWSRDDFRIHNIWQDVEAALTAAFEGSVAVPAIPPSLVNRVVAAMAQRVRLARDDAKDEARADFNEIMKWADAAEAVTRQERGSDQDA